MVIVAVWSEPGGVWRRGRRRAVFEKIGCREAQPLDGGVNLRPSLFEKSLPLIFHERFACAVTDEHAATAPLLDQLLVHELLVAFEDGEWVQPELGSDAADRG